jgi:hypothetical protein
MIQESLGLSITILHIGEGIIVTTLLHYGVGLIFWDQQILHY